MWVSQIGANGAANDLALGLIPTGAGPHPIGFQADEGLQRQLDVVPLRTFLLRLALLNPTALLDPAMIHLNPRGLARPFFPPRGSHRQVAGRPVFRVAVWGDCPKHTNEPVPFQMHHPSLQRDRQRRQRHVARVVRVHQPVPLQTGEPAPLIATDRFQVLQRGIPAVRGDDLGTELPLVRFRQHRPRVLVLVQSAHRLVVEPKVTRKQGVPIGPDQADQVDPELDPVMLAIPVTGDRVYLITHTACRACCRPGAGRRHPGAPTTSPPATAPSYRAAVATAGA
jgi:hypothetical protein